MSRPANITPMPYATALDHMPREAMLQLNRDFHGAVLGPGEAYVWVTPTFAIADRHGRRYSMRWDWRQSAWMYDDCVLPA